MSIVAVGMTVVIVTGGIDLSTGSAIGFTSIFIAIAVERCGRLPPLAASAPARARPARHPLPSPSGRRRERDARRQGSSNPPT